MLDAILAVTVVLLLVLPSLIKDLADLMFIECFRKYHAKFAAFCYVVALEIIVVRVLFPLLDKTL